MAKVGERYEVLPSFIATIDNGLVSRKQIGEVVYVHPSGRYAVLKFDGVNGNPREGYMPDELTPANLVTGKRRKRK